MKKKKKYFNKIMLWLVKLIIIFWYAYIFALIFISTKNVWIEIFIILKAYGIFNIVKQG